MRLCLRARTRRLCILCRLRLRGLLRRRLLRRRRLLPLRCLCLLTLRHLRLRSLRGLICGCLRLSVRGILQSLQFLRELRGGLVHRSLCFGRRFRTRERLLRSRHLLRRGVAHGIREFLKLLARLHVSKPRLVASRTIRPIRRVRRIRRDRLLLLRGIRELRIILLRIARLRIGLR